MARKKVWTKQDYVHRALTVIGAKILRKGNESLIPPMGDLYIRLVDKLEDEKSSRVDALEDKVREVESIANLLSSAGALERTN